jgi:3D (Asp-Asp-Asp) domain-containing protein
MNTNLIRSFKLITDHSYSTRQKKYALSLTELFGKENIRTSEIHAKFTLIHNENYKVTIRTSMNLNANRTCENLEIDEDEEVFKFYMDFIEHTFGEMPEGFTSESSIVNKKLDLFFNKKQEVKKWWTEI